MLQDKWSNDVRAETPIEQQAKQRSKGRRSGGKQKRETVQVITKDLIRNLVYVPYIYRIMLSDF